MSKSEVVKARVEPVVKQEVELIFKQLGLNTTQAITLFFEQVRLCQGLPFEVRIPNDETLQAFKDTDNGIGLTTFDTLEDMLDDLEKD